MQAFVPFIAQSTNKSPTRDQSLRKSDAFARRKSSIDAMTPIIEEDIAQSPAVGLNLSKNDTLSSSKLKKQIVDQKSNEHGINSSEKTLLSGSLNTQRQQSSSSNSSSGSHLCSDDGSLIDMDDAQQDDFVIL